MTAQIPDEILLNGEVLPLLCQPLSPYIRIAGKQSLFSPLSTACCRGYTASWCIQDERLYLTGLSNQVHFHPSVYGSSGHRQLSPISLQDLFPYQPPPILATWFSGTLRIGHGSIFKYFHGGYASVYEWEKYLEVREGQVVASHSLSGLAILLEREERSTQWAFKYSIIGSIIVIVALVLLIIVYFLSPLPLPSFFENLKLVVLLVSFPAIWFGIPFIVASWNFFFQSRRDARKYRRQFSESQEKQGKP